MRGLWIAAWLALAGCAGAGERCSAVLDSFRLPEPEPGGPSETVALLDCTPEQAAMFRANHNAIRAAQLIATPDEAHGTWLGDDVLLYVAGIAVPGQEVLRIGPGATEGALAVTQFWMKAATPDPLGLPWSPDEGYRGIVMEGELFAVPGAGPGQFEPDTFEGGSLRYGAVPLEWERSWDLMVRLNLNHFERHVAFARAGDTLVLEAALLDPLTRQRSSRTMTYTRVAPNAPEDAILLVAVLDLSQALHFDCYAHLITEGHLIEVTGDNPVGYDRAMDFVRELGALSAEQRELMDRGRAGDDVGKAMADWAERMTAMSARAEARVLDALINDETLCADLR